MFQGYPGTQGPRGYPGLDGCNGTQVKCIESSMFHLCFCQEVLLHMQFYLIKFISVFSIFNEVPEKVR